ncbi:Nif3-like dinuclear metal center hexameric protein [Thalassobacillus sp. C254]|uniref:Nif3-like dinuclear metal center hexameric protein n=1 Tax=Thalassobacillus sp. C254 TaxID=1225341 RepID=UPI0006D24182|nr:Nif3-like dinuclear metal center hexameric protein [Thalassobacillus sp. C254]
MTKNKDVIQALDTLTGGRVVKSLHDITGGDHPFVIMKSSNIPGKEVIEIPGLIYGNPEKEINKLAVTMTLTEGSIELAGATGVDAIVAHHPIAEAANSGGVPLKNYLDLYGLSVFELHESFHGLHPGIPFLHGHKVYRSEICFGGLHGNVLFVGQAYPKVNTLGDMLSRLDTFMDFKEEEEVTNREKVIKQADSTIETTLVTRGRILIGEEESPVEHILHIFPHTGFSPDHLRQAVKEHPEADTVLASISRVYEGHPLIETARELGLNFIVGNCHALEILENGLPLAYALDSLLPKVEVVVFRERITSTSLHEMGNQYMKDYGESMASKYLVNKATQVIL